MSDLKVGDVVYLKSGGPAMTINGKASMGAEWSCAWFVDSENKEATFKPESLTKENPKQRKKPIVVG